MKYLLIAACLAIAKADVIKGKTSICYEKETIKTDLQHSTILNMAIDSSTNTLYFRYFQIQDAVNIRTRIAKIELDTNSFKNIEIYNANSLIVDEKYNFVYMGTIDGIYKYGHDTDKVEWIGRMGSHIETLFNKDDVLYYVESASHSLYMYSNGTAVRYEDLEDTNVYEFLIDNKDTMFFTNTTGLFSQKKGTKDAVLLKKFPNGEPKRMNMNKNGDVFVCLSDGIYKINKEQLSLEKIVTLDDCHLMAFDKDNNFVYDNWASLYRLKTSDKTCDVVLTKCTYYERETIEAHLQNSKILDMDIDSSTNTLFFHHFRPTDLYAGTAKIELDTNSYTNLDIKSNSVTIDKENNDIYIGTLHDFYKYNNDTNKFEWIDRIGSVVNVLFYKDDVLYYLSKDLEDVISETFRRFLYTYSNGTSVRYEDFDNTIVDNFLIDNEDTMFFTNTTGLFSQKKGSEVTVLHKNIPNFRIKMNMNKNGDIFVCYMGSIYKIDKSEQSRLKKIVSLDYCSLIAFDKDNNFVYYNWEKLYRLRPINETFCEDN